MRVSFSIALPTLTLALSICPLTVFAKRGVPKPVPPVIQDGVEYRAPHARMGFVEAVAMTNLYIFLAIAVVLGLLAGQLLLLRHKWMEYASAGLQARAARPRVFVRTLSAVILSCAFLVASGFMLRAHAPPHWEFVACLLCCVPAVIVFFFVPLPPAGLIATFGTRTARVIWSVLFGAALTLLFFMFMESYAELCSSPDDQGYGS